MNNPYENQTNHNETEQGRASVSYTAQTNPGAGQTVSGQPAPNQAGTSQPRTGISPSVTYHTGPVSAGNAYIPSQGAPYGAPQSQQPPRTAYTWNPQGQQAAPYYAPVQPPKKKKNGKKAGKFALRLVAAVLCCAVVSLSSVGVFALLIQNGVVNVESQGDAGKTAAFTLYKQVESPVGESSPAVATEAMTTQEAAQKVIPSVVCVQNYQITQSFSYGFGFDFGYGETNDGDSGLSPAGEGSGIIISKDGYIVTNQHVVAGATSLKVVTSEGLTYEAELIGEDTQTDLAVIKVNTEDELDAAEFASSEDLQVADEVMAIGNPGGLQLNSSVTFGRVSALNRQVTNSDTGYTMSCIQTDAAINPGNSGGALVDQNGRVVGINSSKIVATGYEGLGFAIPSDTVQPIISDLMEFGYVKDRPATGFSGQYIDRLTASFYGMDAGYYVTQVASDEARQAGLRRGDMITAVDDTQVTSDSTIDTYIADKKPGDTVTLTVERYSQNGSAQTGEIQLTLSENTGKSEN